jgi:hypothetical protein
VRSQLVLPAPLGPTTTTSPGADSAVVRRQRRAPSGKPTTRPLVRAQQRAVGRDATPTRPRAVARGRDPTARPRRRAPAAARPPRAPAATGPGPWAGAARGSRAAPPASRSPPARRSSCVPSVTPRASQATRPPTAPNTSTCATGVGSAAQRTRAPARARRRVDGAKRRAREAERAERAQRLAVPHVLLQARAHLLDRRLVVPGAASTARPIARVARIAGSASSSRPAVATGSVAASTTRMATSVALSATSVPRP